jgi:parvulin-like peptidyl-prolyl isomerase
MAEPDRVLIQHVLVSFLETPVQAARTRAEAQALAAELLARARAGADFDALTREHSDDPCDPADPAPGRYLVLNHGVAGDGGFERLMDEINARAEGRHAELEQRLAADEITVEEAEADLESFIEQLRADAERARSERGFPRASLVPAFGDVGFALAPGEIGLAEHDEQRSPFGWHLIKRLA